MKNLKETEQFQQRSEITLKGERCETQHLGGLKNDFLLYPVVACEKSREKEGKSVRIEKCTLQ
jgi:hypothetical protein